MVDVVATMTGVDELTKRLEAVKYQTRYKGGRFALRKAAQVVRKAAQTNALKLDDAETGRSIAKNTVERWNGREYRATGDLAFRVGVLHGAVLPKRGEKPNEGAGGPTPHWRLLEFGTEKMGAKPLLRDAMARTVQAATDEFIRQYDKALDRALKKGGA